MSMIFAPNAGGPWSTVSDKYWANVVQLAHFFGASGGSGPFANQAVGKGSTFTNAGTGASLSTTKFKWSPTSLRGASTGNFVQAPTSADYNFGTGDWTVEMWVNIDNVAAVAGVFYDQRDVSNTAAWVPTISLADTSGTIQYFSNGAQRIASGTGAISSATWTHIAACRVSNITRLFVNGTQVGSNFSDSNTYVQGAKMSVNCRGATTGSMNGYYQDVRVTKGIGRYSANFTAPTRPFPNV